MLYFLQIGIHGRVEVFEGIGPTHLFIHLRQGLDGVGIIENGSHTIGFRPPVTRDMIDKYTEDMAVDGTLIQKELGFRPQYDLGTGWKETIKEMSVIGDL